MPVGQQTNLWAVVPLAQRAATWGRVSLWRSWKLILRFGLVLVWRCCFGVDHSGLVVATCWWGIVALPGGCGLQRERLARSWGNTGCDSVPPKTTMHFVKVTAHIGFGSKRFEAHWAGFSSRCAESPRSTSNIKKNNFSFNWWVTKSKNITNNY